MQMFFVLVNSQKATHLFGAPTARAAVFKSLVAILKTDKQEREKMTPSEKRKPKLTRDLIRDPAASLTEEQRLKPQQASGRPGNGYQPDSSFRKSTQQSEAADSGMSPLSSRPADLEGDEVFAFYPSGTPQSEADRPTLVDAVIEQLRQARLRRQRPH
jgi:hypothetical protein